MVQIQLKLMNKSNAYSQSLQCLFRSLFIGYLSHVLVNFKVSLSQTCHGWERNMCENSMVEARWVESGDGVLGEGVCYLPPHQLGGMGSAVISPSGAWGRVPAKIEFNAFWP